MQENTVVRAMSVLKTVLPALNLETVAFYLGANTISLDKQGSRSCPHMNKYNQVFCQLIVKAAFEKECNYYVIGELSERTAKQSSSV